jgi:hypothetical protein
MDFDELKGFAQNLLDHVDPTEAEVRRAISALYYGLFHQLTGAGAALFATGGAPLQVRAARAFNHRDMWAVCRDVVQQNPQTLARQFGPALTNPDPRLILVARAFMRLQEAREIADYDLSVPVTPRLGIDLLDMATQASGAFVELADVAQKPAFLTALLLADRLSRRG